MKRRDIFNVVIRRIFILSILVIAFCVPSTSFAGSTLTVSAVKKGTGVEYSLTSRGGGSGKTVKGDKDHPIEISISYDEIVFSFVDVEKFTFPFYFKLIANGSSIAAKYMVDVDYNKLTAVFTKIGEYTAPTELVTPATKGMNSSYLQAGGTYYDGTPSMGYTFPTYKIEAHEQIDLWHIGSGGDFYREFTLGNGFLNGMGTISHELAAATTSHPAVFVFCATGQKPKDVYAYSDEQSDASFIVKQSDSLRKLTQSQFASEVNNSNINMNITYEFFGMTSEVLDNTEAGWVEQLISRVLLVFGDALWNVMQNVFGKDISIDALIFNQYEPTIVDFFADGSNQGLYYDTIQTVVNGWYEAFRVWSLLILMVVLVAMGVRAILMSGTGKQGKIYDMIVGWIIAIVLLFFGPYFMKYLIRANDALVATIRPYSTSMYSIYNFDFIAKLGLSEEDQYNENMTYLPSGDNTYQTGEDSEVKFINYLYGLQEKISDMTEEQKTQLEELRQRIKTKIEFFNNFFNAFNLKMKIKTALGNSFSSATPVCNVIKTRIRQGYSPEEAVNMTISEITLTNASGTTVQNDTLLATVKQTFLEYAQDSQKIQDLEEASKAINRYLEIADKNVDLMGTMMSRANETKRILFVVIWFILLFQLILLAVMYFKRLLTIAVLIVIYPLVIMFYAIEKLMGIDKPQSLKTWITEYIVNVFIQFVHALVYITLIEASLKIFEEDSDNWLLFFFAVMALFPMESIIKNIIGLRGTTVSNLTDSAKRGMAAGAALGAVASMGRNIATVNKETNKEYDRKEAKLEDKYERQDARNKLKDTRKQNAINRDSIRGANTSERQKQFNAEKEKRDKELDEKREKKRKAMNRRKKAAKLYRTGKAVTAPITAFSMAIAAGGDPDDFVLGAEVANVALNTNKKVPKLTDKEKDKVGKFDARFSRNSSTAGSTNNNGNQNSATGSNNQQTGNVGAPAQNASGGRAADEARRTMEQIDNSSVNTSESGGELDHIPTQKEANKIAKEAAKHAALQDAYRQRIAADISEISDHKYTSFTFNGDTNIDDDM